jgi:hypothetical protein
MPPVSPLQWKRLLNSSSPAHVLINCCFDGISAPAAATNGGYRPIGTQSMLGHAPLDDDPPSVTFDPPDGADPAGAEFQVVVTRHRSNSHHSRSRFPPVVQRTDNVPRSSRDPAPPDWFETIVAGGHLSGSRSHSGVRRRPCAAPGGCTKAEMTLSRESSIRRDIMEQAVQPIKVGKFVFSRQKAVGPAEGT